MTIQLKAVGDICFGDSPKCLGFGVGSFVNKNNPNLIFDKIKSSLTADVLFGNLETVLSDDGIIPYDFYSEQMRGNSHCSKALKNADFNVLNLANNHMMQHGNRAFTDTVSNLESVGITCIGLKEDDGNHSKLKVITVKGKKLGFLGYSIVSENYAPSSGILYAYCGYPHKIIRDIRSVRHKVDWLIVSMHWGAEFMKKPSPFVVQLAHDIVDSGADIILGHHPHVVQEVEEYKNRLICYSLGNFVFDMKWNYLYSKSAIVECHLEHDGSIKYIKTPVKINNYFQPTLYQQERNFFDFIEKHNYDFASMDIESENQKYYKNVTEVQRKDLIRSNVFFLFFLFLKFNVKYFPGKVSYFLRKFKFI